MYEPVIAEDIERKIAHISSIAEDISGIMIIHDIRKWSIVYMSPRGCDELGLSLEEIKGISIDDYHQRFFNPEDAKNYVPKVIEFLEHNTDETISFFQQIRKNSSVDWTWHMSSLKILLRDRANNPILTLTLSFPMNNILQVTTKANRLLEENNFQRKHSVDYSKLGKRESEILKLMALGKSSVEIAN